MVNKVIEIQREITNLEADLEILKQNINLKDCQITSILKVGKKANKGRATKKIVRFAPTRKSFQIKVNSKRAHSCGEKYISKSRKMFNKSNDVFSCPILEYFQSFNSRKYEDHKFQENEESLTNVSSLPLADPRKPLLGFLQPFGDFEKKQRVIECDTEDGKKLHSFSKKVLRSELSLRKELESENRLLKDKLKLAKKNLQHLISIKKELKEERKLRAYTEKQLRDIQNAMNENEIQLQELQEANRCAAGLVDQMKFKYEGALTKRSANEVKNRELESKIDMLASELEKERKRNDKYSDNLILANTFREPNEGGREKDKQIKEEKLKVNYLTNELEQTKKALLESKQIMTELAAKLDELQREMKSKDSTIEILNKKLNQLSEELVIEKKRLESSVELHKQQEILVQALNQTVSSQDNHIQILTKESLFNLKKCDQLEDQLLKLEQNIITLEATNAHLRAINEKESDETMTKDKIIHYHNEIIKSLKKSLEESKVFLDQKLIENEKLMMEIEHSKKHHGGQKQKLPSVECATKESGEAIKFNFSKCK